MLGHLKFAARQLKKSPGFAIVSILSLALGIGANTAIFSLVNSVLLRPVAGIAEPERLVELGRSSRGQGSDTLSHPDLVDLRTGMSSLSHVFGYAFAPLNVRATAESEARRQFGFLVSANYFDALGVRPLLGRAFRAEEDSPQEPPVAIVSHAYWRGALAGAADAVGRTVVVNGHLVTVVGVLPQDFGCHLGVLRPDVFLPMGTQPLVLPEARERLSQRQAFWLLAGGRLAPGSSLEAAAAQLQAVAPGIIDQHPRQRETMGLVIAPAGSLVADLRTPIGLFSTLLFALVGTVLLLATFNVAGLLVARGERRRSEVAMRRALGAGRWAIVRQMLVEAALLLLFAGFLALPLARGAVALALVSMPPTPIPLDLDVPLDARVLAFTLLVGVASVLLFALAPALRVSRQDPAGGLRVGTSLAPRGSRLRNGLVVAQIGGSLLLLFVGGLLLTALNRAGSISVGYEARGAFAVDTDLSLAGYDAARGRVFLDRALERLGSVPGVGAVAAGAVVPLDFESMGFGPVYVAGAAVGAGGDEPSFDATVNIVSPSWFDTLRIPVRGRGFDARDREGAPGVVVINQTAARRFFGEGGEATALGRTIQVESDAGQGQRDSYEVVGVTPNGKYQWLGESEQAFIYFVSSQVWRGEMHLVVRSRADVASVAGAVAREMRALDPNVALSTPRSLESIAASSSLPQRVGASLATGLGVLGLGLAAMGLYGALAMRVGERRREIGIRLALGARPGDVGRWVAREAARLTAWGLAIGLGLALGAGQALRSLLFGASPISAAALLGAPLTLCAIALLAALGPIRQAVRVDPSTTLRSE